jgi:hypothetical protein
MSATSAGMTGKLLASREIGERAAVYEKANS